VIPVVRIPRFSLLKEIMVIPGASHFDLYDKPQYVTPAVNKLAEFFGKNL
jgi:uncharacterized protein